MSTTLIDIRDLTWHYPKSSSPVFEDFSFSFQEKDFCIIQGKSGCGKTTLVKMLTGYITPPKKSVFFAADDIARLSNKERQQYRRHIGTVFQENKLLPDMSVRETVCYPLLLYGAPKEYIKKRYQTVIDYVGLATKSDIHIRFLSGGEKQKIAIARAIIHKPDFVIADEPTGNLDRQSSRNIADLFVQINKSGTSILFITHNQDLVQYLEKKHSVSHQTL